MKKIGILVISLILFLICRVVFSWYGEAVDYRNIALSPDEEKIVFECIPSYFGGDFWTGIDVMLVDVDGSNLTHLTHEVLKVVISPDRSKVLFSTPYGLFEMGLDLSHIPKQIYTRFPGDTFDSRDGEIHHISWSPDSKWILFSKSCGAGAETEICIMHYPDGEIEILDRIWGRVQEINWSPNSRYIVYAKEGNIWRYDIEAKKKKQLTTQGGIFSPFYLSDDTKILYFRDSNLWIMNSDGNNQKLLFSKIIGLPLCSRDGTMFAVKDKDDIWIYVRNKKIHIFHDPHYITEICWSPDSKRIIFISGYQIDTNKDGKITDEDEHFVDLKVIDLKTKKVKTILKGKKSLKNLSFSPYDSKMIFEMEGYIWISNYRKGYKMKKITKGEVPQWISDSEILYLNENSLYYKHIEMNQGMRLTIAHGESPVWFKDSKRVAVKDKGKYWSINLDRLEIEQINKLPTTKRKMRGKEIIVFTKKSKDSYREDYTTEEIWVKNIDGSNPRMVKSAWNNW